MTRCRLPDPGIVTLLLELVVFLVVCGFLLRLITNGLPQPVRALVLLPFRWLGRLAAVALAAAVVVAIVLVGPSASPVGASSSRGTPDTAPRVRVQIQWTDNKERNVSGDAVGVRHSCKDDDDSVTAAQVQAVLEKITAEAPKKITKLKSFRRAKTKMTIAIASLPASGGAGNTGKNILRKEWGDDAPKDVRRGTGRIDVENIRGTRNLTR